MLEAFDSNKQTTGVEGRDIFYNNKRTALTAPDRHLWIIVNENEMHVPFLHPTKFTFLDLLILFCEFAALFL